MSDNVLSSKPFSARHAFENSSHETNFETITLFFKLFKTDILSPYTKNRKLQIDLATPADVERGVAELKSRLNRAPLHALVDNAGISPKSADGRRLDSVSGDLALWQQVYQVNVFAPLMLAKSLLDCLQAGSGTVVNVTSIAGGRVHEFAGSAYATSKAALSALTREMASDFGKRGVRVNAIAPGEIKTDILSPDSEAAILPQIPMRRFGTADEVADTIFFLCSDQANYVNGAEIHVNGGQHV